jgi:hypothetical protein
LADHARRCEPQALEPEFGITDKGILRQVTRRAIATAVPALIKRDDTVRG